MLKLTTDQYEPSSGLFATAELLVLLTCSLFGKADRATVNAIIRSYI